MGFFDKKSRLLRRKMSDLQAELKQAEKGGTYEVKEGVFFAKLAAMGDQTLMAFAAADNISAKEETVIEQFFSRNGFHVERCQIDSKTGKLTDLYIEPPQEMIMAMGRDLKTAGYRMIDDSETEPRKPDLNAGVYPLSVLLDTIICLFSERVRELILSTEIKSNKEGNRLLGWMPEIVNLFTNKYGSDVIDAAREAFENAYGKLFSGMVRSVTKNVPRPQAQQIEAYKKQQEQKAAAMRSAEIPVAPASGTILKPPIGSPVAPATSGTAERRAARDVSSPAGYQVNEPAPTPARELPPLPPLGGLPPLIGGGGPTPTTRPNPLGMPSNAMQAAGAQSASVTMQKPPTLAAAYQVPHLPGDDLVAKLQRELAFHRTRADMYKALIRANSSRVVSNARLVLECLMRLYDASSVALLVKRNTDDALALLAQAGQPLAMPGSAQGQVITFAFVNDAMRHKEPVSGDDGVGGHIMCVPIVGDADVAGIIYVDRRAGRAFNEPDKGMAGHFAKLFSEHGDLLLGSF